MLGALDEAALATWLAAHPLVAVTGQTLVVDGGAHIVGAGLQG